MKNKIKDVMSELSGDDGGDVVKKAKLFKNKFAKMLSDLSAEEKTTLDDLMILCMETGDNGVMEIFVEPILQKKKFIAWKTKEVLLKKMIGTVVEVSKRKPDKARFNGVVGKLIEMMEAYSLTKTYKKELIEIMRLSFETSTPHQHLLHLIAINVFNKFPWPDKASATEVMTMATEYVNKYGSHPADSVFCSNFLSFTLFAYHMRGNDLEQHREVLPLVKDCFESASNADWEAVEEPGNHNIYRSFVLCILKYFVQTSNGTKEELLKPVYECVKAFRGTTGDEEIEEVVTKLLSDVADNEDFMGDDVGGMLEEFVEGRNNALAHKLKDIYLKQTNSFQPHLESLSSLLKVPQDATCSSLLMLFTEVAKQQPQLLPTTTSQHICNILQHEWYYSLALLYFDALAMSSPHDVIKYEDDIIQTAVKYEAISSSVAMLLPKIAVDDEKKAKYLDYLASECSKKKATPYLPCYLYSMRMIGMTDPKLLKPHKPLFLDMLELPTARDLAQSSLDVIEGRSLQKVSEKTEENRGKIEKVGERIEVITDDVEEMKENMDEMDDSMDGLKRDMDENGMRIDGLIIQVDDTEKHVMDIDNKTLSHAPSWSRDVSKLLTDQSGDKDWKLLGRRLGYSSEDLANWSLHSDPCMALLDDWFAKNNAREATRGVLSILDDMQAKEAWRVVDEAVKKAEDILGDDDEDNEDGGVAKQPVVFLSYQWAHQNEVKLLRQHLEMCGFPCWMDVGQMGGGDKLYRKIDEGMRKAKVVLCCVSSRYAESPNCNREVNLAVTLGKSLIPLLMEQMNWPPVGGMGPIFGEFLYIQFFTKGGRGGGGSSCDKGDGGGGNGGNGGDKDGGSGGNGGGNDGGSGSGGGKTMIPIKSVEQNKELKKNKTKRDEKENVGRETRGKNGKKEEITNKNSSAKEEEKVNEKVYWPVDNFHQLALQIQTSVPADFEMIPKDSPYKKWFNPPSESAKSSTYHKTSVSSRKSSHKIADDKHKDIKKGTSSKTNTNTGNKTNTQTSNKSNTLTHSKTNTHTSNKTNTQTCNKTNTQTGSRTSLLKTVATVNTKWPSTSSKISKK